MDPFETLGLPTSFDVDSVSLEKRHRELSRALHPDRYVSSGASERKAALSKAIEINESFRIVRDTVRRAEALFRIAGVPVGEANEPKALPAFLMDVMDRREALSEARDARDVSAVRKLAAEIEARAKACEASLSRGFRAAIDDKEALAPLVAQLGELRFFRRFLEEVSAIEDDLETLA
jgi:molecular chaperone HscB